MRVKILLLGNIPTMHLVEQPVYPLPPPTSLLKTVKKGKIKNNPKSALAKTKFCIEKTWNNGGVNPNLNPIQEVRGDFMRSIYFLGVEHQLLM